MGSHNLVRRNRTHPAEPGASGRRKGAHTQARVDARVRRSQETVLAATWELLQEAGLGRLSVDAVAARSGVAKTTIYRHWPTRSALVLDACSRLGSGREAPDTGSLKGDMTVLAGDLAHRLRTARWASVLPSIVDAAERDAELARMHARLHAELVAAFRAVAERAHKRGELPRGRQPSDIVAAIIGPLIYRRWLSREPLDDRFVKAVVENAVGG
jgi:AcrR family transcriptional regulator